MDTMDLAHGAFNRFLAIHHHLRSYERQMTEHGVKAHRPVGGDGFRHPDPFGDG